MTYFKAIHLNRTEKILLAGAIFLLCLSAYFCVHAANSTDKNWLLFAAGKWLSGGRLYVDIFEVNPPLIVWLYAVPYWIFLHTGFLSAYQALALLMFTVIAIVLWLCVRLIALHPAFMGRYERQLAFLLLLALVFVFFVVPTYFSDREHIFFVLTFPYVLRFMPSLARQPLPLRLRIMIGVLASVGFCIKPHTLVVFAVLQLLYMWRERSASILISAENIIICCAGALYGAGVVLFMPEYVHTVVPMALATYSAYSRKANGLTSIIVFVVIAGLTFADFRPRHSSPYRQGVYYFLGVCMGYLAYGLLNNGWAYTYIPLLSMARVLSGWVLLEFIWLKKDAEARGEPARQFRFGIRSCGINLALNTCFYVICFAAYFLPVDCGKSLSCRSTVAFFEQAGKQPAHSFGAISLEFYKWPELSRQTGERWDTRFNHLWMLPKFLLSGPQFAKENQWIIDYVGRAYAEDLTKWNPDVVYVDSSPEVFSGHEHVDLPAYLSQVDAFKQVWSHYRRTGVIDSCVKPPKSEREAKPVMVDCRFDLYRRMPGT